MNGKQIDVDAFDAFRRLCDGYDLDDLQILKLFLQFQKRAENDAPNA